MPGSIVGQSFSNRIFLLIHPLQHNISVGVCQITHVSCLWNINLPFHYNFLKPETFAIVMNELVNIAWLDKSFLSFHRKMALFITYVVVPLILKFCVFCNDSILGLEKSQYFGLGLCRPLIKTESRAWSTLAVSKIFCLFFFFCQPFAKALSESYWLFVNFLASVDTCFVNTETPELLRLRQLPSAQTSALGFGSLASWGRLSLGQKQILDAITLCPWK